MNEDILLHAPEREPINRIAYKRWRVYYNCREHFPHLAAVDNGTVQSQIRVQHVLMRDCVEIFGNSDMGKPRSASQEIDSRKGKPNEPTWWIELYAFAVFENGGVIFHGGDR